jgi:hypothetical protein
MQKGSLWHAPQRPFSLPPKALDEADELSVFGA